MDIVSVPTAGMPPGNQAPRQFDSDEAAWGEPYLDLKRWIANLEQQLREFSDIPPGWIVPGVAVQVRDVLLPLNALVEVRIKIIYQHALDFGNFFA